MTSLRTGRLSRKPKKIFLFLPTSDIIKGKELLVINNFYGIQTRWDAGEDLTAYECLLGNYDQQDTCGTEVVLKPYETMILYK
mgnify:CR=1 FL=1